MSDSLDAHLRELARQDPQNRAHYDQLRRSSRKFRQARGDRPMPPRSTLEAARARLLVQELTPRSPLHVLNGTLPIDRLVAQYIDNGHIPVISPEAQAAGEVGTTRAEAFWEARQSVIDGCRWGDYYAKFKRGAEQSAKAHAKLGLVDAKTVEAILADFLTEHGLTLGAGRYTAAGVRGSNVQNHLSPEIETLRAAHDALARIVERLTPEAVDTGGRPGDPWRIGFVFGISHGWMGLSPLKVSKKDASPFAQFVASGAASLTDAPPPNNDAWSSAIATAIRTFELGDDGRSWLRRPGPQPEGVKPTP